VLLTVIADTAREIARPFKLTETPILCSFVELRPRVVVVRLLRLLPPSPLDLAKFLTRSCGLLNLQRLHPVVVGPVLVCLNCSRSSTQFLTNVPSWTWQDCKRKVAQLLELTETPHGGSQSRTRSFELQLRSRLLSFLVVYEFAVAVFCLSTSRVGPPPCVHPSRERRQGEFGVVDPGVGLPQLVFFVFYRRPRKVTQLLKPTETPHVAVNLVIVP
jgi:hypothetical protein